MNEQMPTNERSAQWVFVRARDGRATNVRCLRGTTIIEVLHKGEKILVDIAEIQPLGTLHKDCADYRQAR